MKVKIADINDINICYKLREIIFIKGQNVPPERERDAYDKVATHFLLIENDTPIGVGRVIITQQPKTATIERIGILKEYRGTGAGFFLMKEIIDYCKKQKLPKIILGAQEHAIAFYEKLGFEICGEKYIDANIPHYKMQLHF